MSDKQLLLIKFREAGEDSPALVGVFQEGHDSPLVTLGVVGEVTKARKEKICQMFAQLVAECLDESDAPLLTAMPSMHEHEH
jgi:hypothetical protein